MRIDNLLIFLSCSFLLLSCNKVLHTSDIAHQISNHKTMAILPPITSIQSMEGGDFDTYKGQMDVESKSFQEKLITWFHIAQSQGKISVSIQDLLMTNDKLKEIGYFDGKQLSVTEVCEALEVDGLLCSHFNLATANTNEENFQLGAMDKKHKNKVEVNMELFDGISKKVIWRYAEKLTSQESFTNDLVAESLMRKAIKKMPYNHDLKFKEQDDRSIMADKKDLEF